MTNFELSEMFRLQARQKLGLVQGTLHDKLMDLEEKYMIHRQVFEEQHQMNNDYRVQEKETWGGLLMSVISGAAIGYAAAKALNYDQMDKK